MEKEIKYNEDLKEILDQIKIGAFLTVKSGEIVNTMTIGWATFGVIWNKPILMVLVRKSRYSFDLIEKARDFTVSIPVEIDLKKALSYCGSYSGRDVNKFKEAGLSLKESKSVVSPIIKNCDYHYECKIIFSQPMTSDNLESTIVDRFYSTNDYHTLYFGEILQSYKTVG